MTKKLFLSGLIVVTVFILASCTIIKGMAGKVPTAVPAETATEVVYVTVLPRDTEVVNNTPTAFIAATATVVNKPTITPTAANVQATQQPFKAIDCALDSISPVKILGEKLNIAWNTKASQAFSTDKEANFRVFWTQSTQDYFDLTIDNQDPSLKNSVEKTTTLESSVGPSSGCVDVDLTAGNYQMVVKNSAGSWQIWMEEIEYQ